jgi:uncharacterized repeat protein (TIGR03847 family)
MLPEFEQDMFSVTHITADAIGESGQRVFYIQASDENQIVTILVEKIQIQTLAVGVEQFLAEVATRYPDLTPASSKYDESKMLIIPPVDPLFRAGELGLSYDIEKDMIILIARETLPEGSDKKPSLIRFWCTRSQLRALCSWGMELSNRGRPVCPQCGEPINPTGHFCPKKNGHKH